MDLKLEVIMIPVSDVDRARKFYQEALGFRLEAEFRAATYEEAIAFRHPGFPSYHVVQLTPPGSGCSIHIGTGITKAQPGSSQGMYLVTSDLAATRTELVARGVDVSEPFYFGPEGKTPGLEPNRATYFSYASFSDPDGNGWLIQEVTERFPGR
ncbi:MAG: VOC family protein [Blastocatellia bacterium]|nr:VOC family protein [Blastocatellia bacterium]